MVLETERLRIYPATQEQMEAFIAAETDVELKSAYSEMLQGCLLNPEQWELFAMWIIELSDGTHIGDLCFKGLISNGITEIGYGIMEEYQGSGYATEAVKAAVKWAFENLDINAIEAETEIDNTASQRVLEKCGFVANGKIGAEGPRYSLFRISD
ncbi:MAG: GNAT family N-acetyltransferase [Clostridia bacterium]|nr:GNAT family N-acetyltransferase [Clostridia bacterium]